MKLVGTLLGAMTLGLLWHSQASAASRDTGPAPKQPNIVLIVADDLGYSDLSCHGCKDFTTPQIDSLAKNGVRCTNGYASCFMCSPARAGFLTGRYQQRFGHEFNIDSLSAGAKYGLPLTEKTMADRLQALGYVTGMVGKWHLGLSEKHHPMRRGFVEYFGFLHGVHAYLNPQDPKGGPIVRGSEAVDEKEYLTDAFSREAVAFIDRHQKRPFFLYLSYNAPHTPLEAPAKYLRRFPGIADEKRRTYAGMVSAMDDGIGAVLAKLRQVGVDQDTLIFFLSDNGGGAMAVNASENEPLRGGKYTLLEGGVRVPFLVQWPRRLPKGKVYDQPVSALDILATAVAAGGGKLPEDAKIDGADLLPHLTGENTTPPHDVLYWRIGSHYAIRKGNWKLIQVKGKPIELYDLATDSGEKTNLAEQKPAVVTELDTALKQWDSQLVPPLWGVR